MQISWITSPNRQLRAIRSYLIWPSRKRCIQWASEKEDYINLLNQAIPCEALKIKNESQRVLKRLRNNCWKTVQKLKKLNREGSKKKREGFLIGATNLRILVSEVVSAAQHRGIARTCERLSSKTSVDELQNKRREEKAWQQRGKKAETSRSVQKDPTTSTENSSPWMRH